MNKANYNNTSKINKPIITRLDIDTNKCNNRFGGYSTFGHIENEGVTKIVRVTCKKWSCSICGPKNAYKLKNSIIHKAQEKKLQRLLTLTLDPSKFQGDSIEYINKCWTKLRVYLSRKYGRSITFIRILELHKSGQAHFHILIDRFIPFEWIKKAWKTVGGGGVDIRFVDIHRVAGYLAKYLTKDLFINLPKGKRRYSTSKNLRLTDKKEASGWTFIKIPIEFLYDKLKKAIQWEKWDDDSIMAFDVKGKLRYVQR